MKAAIAHPDRRIAEALREVLSQQPETECLWIAGTESRLLEQFRRRTPDTLLLAANWPGSTASEVTARIDAIAKSSILLLMCPHDSDVHDIFEALGCGATDAAVVPDLDAPQPGPGWVDVLNRLDTLAKLNGQHQPRRTSSPAAPGPYLPPPVIAIGASTGGPKAISGILSALPANLPAAVLVVQHLEYHFIQSFADWLDERTPLKVEALLSETRLAPGRVWVAGRPEHMVVDDRLGLGWSSESPELVCRPAIDVLFESIARQGAALKGCGVLLTGMGRDGAKGLLAMRRAGFRTVAQDRDSSVVFGMPKAAIELDAADAVLPVERIAEWILEQPGCIHDGAASYPGPG